MSSMMSLDKRLLFIHVPKTAGSSITYTYHDLFDVPGPGINTHRGLEEFENWQAMVSFCVVRNPWEMCASWLQWHEDHDDHRKTLDIAIQKLRTPREFRAAEMSHVLRFENLRDELAQLFVGYGIRPRQLLRLNWSTRKDYRRYYNDAQAERVGKKFWWCIKRFGYEFN